MSIREYSEAFAEVLDILTSRILIRTLILLLLFVLLVAYMQDSIVQSPLTISNFVNLLLVAVTAAMVWEIRSQVMEQRRYLQNFEPSLSIFERDPHGSSVQAENIRDRETIEGWFVVFNPSQTATIINDAEIKEAPRTRVRRHGLRLEKAEKVRNESDYSNNIPVEENDGILFKFRVVSKEWNLRDDEEDKILEQGYLTLVIKGDFGQEEFGISVE